MSFRRRDIVEVVQSKYCDVRVGMVGVIESFTPEGYAVRFHGNFTNATAVATSTMQDRTFHFLPSEIKRPEVKVQDKGLADTLERLKLELRSLKRN